jgi:hypothetical protein
VLFLDILGVSEMALDSAHVSENLVDLDRVLRRTSRDFLAEDSPWPSALLSDSLIIADPTSSNSGDVFVLIEMLIQAAILQLQLAAGGFFARGALTIGDIHIHDGVVFGPALVKAYRLEAKRAISPRVILTQEAREALEEDLSHYKNPEDAPQVDLLVVDQDGIVFIDYLRMLFDEIDPVEELEWHRTVVEEKLRAHRNDSRKWDKYRWVAEYHNHFCERRIKAGPLIPGGETAMQLEQFG